MKNETERVPKKWTEMVEQSSASADRCGMDDVVRVALARELAARLEECQRDRLTLIKSMAPGGPAQAALLAALRIIADGRQGPHCTSLSAGQMQEYARAAIAQAEKEAA